MERQTKHRILGILVIIGLVIILLPLFQSNKELSTEAALVQAPPFPDQPVQVTAVIPESAPINPAEQTEISQPVANSLQVSDNNHNHQPDDVIRTTHPNIINTIEQPALQDTEKTTIENINNNKRSDPIKTSDYRIIEGDKAVSILKKSARTNRHTHRSKTQSVSANKTPLKTLTKIDDDGLAKLKSAVWVIQIGSFKNKANALRIVNQLRASGYRAFIQQITTALGDNTRVFVGPEQKRTTASALAARLQSEMHIQGIVISYKPLTL